MFELFPIFKLAVKKARSTKVQHVNNLSRTRVPNTTYHVSVPSVYWFKRKFLKDFIYGHGGHVGHVTTLISVRSLNFRIRAVGIPKFRTCPRTSKRQNLFVHK